MKKLLFTLSFLVIGAAANAQCTPGANYADSVYGVWPDTTQNFPLATQGVSYTTDLNFKVPTDASLIDPQYQNTTIQSFVVNSVTGLPAGISYACNISNCTYAGGANGCAQLNGTPTTAGTYPITINVTAAAQVFGLPGTISVPRSFTGYKIIVGSLGIATLEADVTLSPNPAYNELNIDGLVATGTDKIEIYNMAGTLVKSVDSVYDKVNVNISDFTEGVYMVRLSGPAGTITKKFVKK